MIWHVVCNTRGMSKHRRERFIEWMFDTAVILLIAGCVGFVAGMIGGCTYSPQAMQGDDATPDDGPPSCAELEPTCGASGMESCCATGMVQGGTFDRGRDVATDGMFSDATHPATVHTFMLDTYEVTVGRYRKFLDAGMGTRATPPNEGAGARTLGGIPNQGGWQRDWGNNLFSTPPANLYTDLACSPGHDSWTEMPGANESSAMSCVSWFEAFAFCVWDGGFLPTETEWNYAAAGGSEQRAYPWSNPAASLDVDCSFANYNISPGDNGPFCSGLAGHPDRVGATSPEGDGKWGQADLGGNVNEWVLDGFGPYSDVCDDCANLSDVTGRVLHSGTWANGAATLRTAYRQFTDPQSNRDPKIGFRCARSASGL